MSRRFNTMPWGIGEVIRRKGSEHTLKIRAIDYQGKYQATSLEGHVFGIYPCDYHLYEAV